MKDTLTAIRALNTQPGVPLMLRRVGIHGGGFDPDRDWTLDCSALDDRDVIELYELLLDNPNGGIGTLVYIAD